MLRNQAYDADWNLDQKFGDCMFLQNMGNFRSEERTDSATVHRYVPPASVCLNVSVQCYLGLDVLHPLIRRSRAGRE